MSESIKQLSHELNISPQAIRERMGHFKGFRYNHVRIIRHRLIINDKGVKMLKNYQKYGNISNYHNSNLNDSPLIDQLRSDLKNVRSDLDHEHKQNDYLQEQNSRLTIILEQSARSNHKLLKSHESDQKLLNANKTIAKHHGLIAWLKGLFN